jgi:hypothetical protein
MKGWPAGVSPVQPPLLPPLAMCNHGLLFVWRRLEDAGADPSFVCERVCTSQRLMRRMGSLAKVRGFDASCVPERALRSARTWW